MSRATETNPTVAQTLARGIMLLAKTSESARADAQILLAHCLQRDRSWLVAHAESFMNKAQADRYIELCEKRKSGVPVAYILGTAGFYGREFYVNEHVLIPRPETEILVDEAVAHLRKRFDPDYPKRLSLALDIGTGSGAIACTLAAEVPNAAVEAVDISADALKIAEKNASRCNVRQRCKFYNGDLLAPIGERQFDVVIANLPYVPTSEIAPSPDPVSYEPRLALDGGADGLDLYRKVLPQLARFLKADALVLLEAAPPAIHALVELCDAYFDAARISVGRDAAGLDRFVRII